MHIRNVLKKRELSAEATIKEYLIVRQEGSRRVLRHDLHHRLSVPGHPERNRRIDWEAAKTRVLSILKRRAEKGDPGLQNAEVRQIVHMDRQQVNRLIHELEEEGQVRIEGHGRGARYSYIGGKEA
jgi:ATP-dependent DNA helicase RecG